MVDEENLTDQSLQTPQAPPEPNQGPLPPASYAGPQLPGGIGGFLNNPIPSGSMENLLTSGQGYYKPPVNTPTEEEPTGFKSPEEAHKAALALKAEKEKYDANLAATHPDIMKMFGIPQLNAAFAQSGEAQKAYVQAQGEEGKKQAAILGDYQKLIEAHQEQQEQQNIEQAAQMTEAHNNMKASIDALGNSKIDPNRYMNNRTTADKVRMGFAIALAGIADAGAVYSGRGPVDHAKNVYNIIDTNVKRDIEAQIFDYNKLRDKAQGQNMLFGQQMQIWHNQSMAANASQILGMQVMQNKLAQSAANSTSAMAPALEKMIGSSVKEKQAMLMNGILMGAAKGQQKTSPMIQTKLAAYDSAIAEFKDILNKKNTFPGGFITQANPWSDASTYNQKWDTLAPFITPGFYPATKSLGPEHVKSIKKTTIPYAGIAENKRQQMAATGLPAMIRARNSLANQVQGGSAPVESFPEGEEK